MTIIGEVNNPKPGKSPEGLFWFEGVPNEQPLRLTELNVWQQGLHRFLETVKDVSVRMTRDKPKAKKKR
jgi:hypothetical protein